MTNNRIQFIQLEDGVQQISGSGILELDAGNIIRIDTSTISNLLDVVNVEYLNNTISSLGNIGINTVISVNQTIDQDNMYNIWGDFTIDPGNILNNDGRIVIVNGDFTNNGTYNQGVSGSIEIVNTNLDYILGRGNTVNGQDILWTDSTGNWSAGDSTLHLDSAAGNVYVTKEWVESKTSQLVYTIRTDDKNLVPLDTIGNEQYTGIDITYTPIDQGHVDVKVNGASVILGDGVKTTDCYFSSNLGASALLIQDISAGDSLYWNGLNANYNLDSNDSISLFYIS